GGTGAAAGGGANGTANANVDLAGILGDPLAALLGVPGLMIDPAQPFVGHLVTLWSVLVVALLVASTSRPASAAGAADPIARFGVIHGVVSVQRQIAG